MEGWRKELMDKAEEVVERGWGRVEIVVTNNGMRRQFSQTFTDVDEEKPLQKYKKEI